MADNIPTVDQSANAPVPTILSGAASQPAMPMPQVDTPSAPAPTPAPIPSAEQSAISPIPAIAQSDATPPGPAKPGLWAGILQGALVGLAGSAGAKHFGGGLAMGAEGFEKNEQLQKENAVQQQQLAMQKTFQSAQAAEMIVNAHVKEKQLANMDQEQRDAHNTQALDQIERLKQIFPGAIPTITPNTPEATVAAMKSDAAANGGVGPKLIFNVGDNHVSFDINQLSQAPQALTLINESRRVAGQAILTPSDYAKFTPTQQADMINKAGLLGTETPTAETLSTYKNYLETAKARPDDGNKAADVARLTGIVKRMEKGVDASNAAAAKQAGAVKGAEKAVEEPYEERERISASQQQQKMMEAMKNLTFGQESLKDSTKAWTDQQHGYLQANANFNMVDNAINQAKDGNGLTTSFAPAMEALGVSVAQGSHRVSPADAAAAGAPGGWAERFNAWADKAASGKLSPQLVQEGHTLINDLRQSKYAQAISQSRIDAASGRLPASQVPVFDPKGNLTTLDKAPTHTVMGSDKKLHYTNDLHQDLGVVQ